MARNRLSYGDRALMVGDEDSRLPLALAIFLHYGQRRLCFGVTNGDRSDQVLRRRDQWRRNTKSAKAHPQEIWNYVFAASQFATDRN